MLCKLSKLTENGQQTESDLVVEQIRSDQIQLIVIGHVAEDARSSCRDGNNFYRYLCTDVQLLSGVRVVRQRHYNNRHQQPQPHTK